MAESRKERNVKPTEAKLVRDQVTEWLDADVIRDLDYIKVNNVYDNRFRVNVYTRVESERMFTSTYAIAASYFVHLVDGVVIDKTLAPLEN